MVPSLASRSAAPNGFRANRLRPRSTGQRRRDGTVQAAIDRMTDPASPPFGPPNLRHGFSLP
jgi:hypothetical protein